MDRLSEPFKAVSAKQSWFSVNVSRYLARGLFLSCGVGGVNEKNLENKKRRRRRFLTASVRTIFF